MSSETTVELKIGVCKTSETVFGLLKILLLDNDHLTSSLFWYKEQINNTTSI